ncbi:MAG: putative quinol monooxygenase [Acidimicrobiales bacterium]
MIVVIGDVSIRDGSVDAAVALSREHVERSRREPGCISHDVHHHVDDARRLVFVERWADRTALDAHFAVPESVAFARELAALATGPPSIEVHEVLSRPSAN